MPHIPFFISRLVAVLALVFGIWSLALAQTGETEKLTIHTSSGAFDFNVEIADEPSERSQGLMHREEMPARNGMLFIFDETRLVTMWMQNTPLSLDMIFVNPDGTVATIATRTTPFSTDVISSRVPVSHVLEVNAGISALIGLKPGDRLEHETFASQ